MERIRRWVIQPDYTMSRPRRSEVNRLRKKIYRKKTKKKLYFTLHNIEGETNNWRHRCQHNTGANHTRKRARRPVNTIVDILTDIPKLID